MSKRLLTETGGSSGWRMLRERVLNRDGYCCQIGGPHCAGEADCVDHIIERREGGPDEEWNLRAACTPCNQARNKASFPVGPATAASVANHSLPDEPVSERDHDQPPGDLVGSTVPRLSTPKPGGKSLGSDLSNLAELVGLPLLPWQAHVADQAHVVDDQGNWVASSVLLLVARQNGKTALLALRVLAGLFLWQERSILAIAQNRALSRDLLIYCADLAYAVPELADQLKSVRLANGQESITTNSGCRLRIAAANARSARGLTVDTLIVDEVREFRDESVAAAFAPTMMARPNPQAWYCSNAGDQGSVVLNRLRDQGRRAATNGDTDLAYFEYSAHPDCGLFDYDGWAQANPALGHTITSKSLYQRVKTDPPATVRTEALCQWVDALESPWPLGAWEACSDETASLDPERRTVIGLDVSPDRRLATVLAVQQVDTDHHYVNVLDVLEADDALDELKVAGVVAKHARALNAETVAYDKWTASGVASRLASAGIATEDGSGGKFARACDGLLSAMVSGRIAHNPGENNAKALTNHMTACARTRASDGGWRIVRSKSSNPVTAAVALAMALYEIAAPKQEAQIHIG